MLIRPGPTRVETYCSKLFLNVPRWRRSKFSTAGSWVTPESACEITVGEIPAACASADIAATKLLKSPPQWAAWEGVAMTVPNKIAKQNLRMRIPCDFLNSPDHAMGKWRAAEVFTGLDNNSSSRTSEQRERRSGTHTPRPMLSWRNG